MCISVSGFFVFKEISPFPKIFPSVTSALFFHFPPPLFFFHSSLSSPCSLLCVCLTLVFVWRNWKYNMPQISWRASSLSSWQSDYKAWALRLFIYFPDPCSCNAAVWCFVSWGETLQMGAAVSDRTGHTLNSFWVAFSLADVHPGCQVPTCGAYGEDSHLAVAYGHRKIWCVSINGTFLVQRVRFGNVTINQWRID